MSYDNDLAHHAETILDDLHRASIDTEIAVSILLDTRDARGLRRVTLTSDGRRDERLASEDSASTDVLDTHLDWVRANLSARHTMVAFLDHGGGMDEMCWDWDPGDGGGPRWMSARAIAPVLEQFRTESAGEVDLLFLQQCGRASAGNLHTFRDAAPWILASQGVIGAPNTYYANTLAWLDAHPDAGGDELAREIMANETQYVTLSLVDSAASAELPTRIRAVVDATPQTAAQVTSPALCYGALANFPETSYDLMRWLEAANGVVGTDSNTPLGRLRSWLRYSLVVEHRYGPVRIPERRSWCGVSLFVPTDPDVRDRHRDHPFLVESGLRALFDQLYP